MRRVARDAGRRHNEPLLHQGLAVDALRIILQDMVFVDLPLALDGAPLLMAAAADPRDPLRGDRGARVAGLQDFVVAVAILAARRELVPPRDRPAVERSRVVLLFLTVAAAALHRTEGSFVRQILPLQVHMAADARKAPVDRSAELLLVHEE